MKKFWVVMLVLALSLTGLLVGCSQSPKENPTSSTPASSEKKEQQTTGKSVNYPNKPITLVCGSSAGAPIDVMARKFAEIAEKYLGQPINVVNKPGGSGMVSMAYTLSKPGDGYTLQTEATGFTSILQTKSAQMSFKEFTPVARLEMDPFALFVAPDSPYQSMKDLIEAAKKSPKSISIGGYGTGSPQHFIPVLLGQQNNVVFKWVTFNSGSDAMVNLIGGSIDAVLSNASQMPRFEGKVKMLGHTSESPLEGYPDVPSFKDQGFDMVKYHWRGIIVNKETPQEIVDVLADVAKKVQEDPKWAEYLESTGNLNGFMQQKDFAAFIEQQAKDDLPILQSIGLAN